MEQIKLAKLKDLYLVQRSDNTYTIALWSRASGLESGLYALRALLVSERPDGKTLIKCNNHINGIARKMSDILLSDYFFLEKEKNILEDISIHAGTLIRWIDFIDSDFAQEKLQQIPNSASVLQISEEAKEIKKELLSCMLVDYSVFAKEDVNAAQNGSGMGNQ